MASHLVTAQPGRATLADQARLNRQRRIALALHARQSRPVEPPDYVAIARRTLNALDLKTVRRSDIAYAVAKASRDAMSAFVARTCTPLRESIHEREQRRWEAALRSSMGLAVDLEKPPTIPSSRFEVFS